MIARNPITDEVMGISVKSRSRNEGKEGTFVSIPNDNFDKIDRACRAFNCIPYFAILVDEENTFKMFMLSKQHLVDLFPLGERTCSWKMTTKWLEFYENDEQIIKMEFKYSFKNWW